MMISRKREYGLVFHIQLQIIGSCHLWKTTLRIRLLRETILQQKETVIPDERSEIRNPVCAGILDSGFRRSDDKLRSSLRSV